METADACFITDTATSLRSSDSAKRFLSDVLADREHTHYQQLIALNVLLPPVVFDIRLLSGTAQIAVDREFILSSSRPPYKSPLTLSPAGSSSVAAWMA